MPAIASYEGQPCPSAFIDPAAKPIACHKPGKVPVHFKDRVEAELRRDVRLGVLEEVPPSIQTKKNGNPRRVIDYIELNKHAVRQTHAGESPFEIVSEVPPNTYRASFYDLQ